MSWWQRFTSSSGPAPAPGHPDEPPPLTSFTWPASSPGATAPGPTPSRAADRPPGPAPRLPAASSPAADDQLVLPALPPGTRPPTFVDRVDVNAATATELAVLPGISLAGASRAVDLRDLGGSFTDVEEFLTAAGVDLADQPRLRTLLACHKPQKPYNRSAPYRPDARILDV